MQRIDEAGQGGAEDKRWEQGRQSVRHGRPVAAASQAAEARPRMLHVVGSAPMPPRRGPFSRGR